MRNGRDWQTGVHMPSLKEIVLQGSSQVLLCLYEKVSLILPYLPVFLEGEIWIAFFIKK